MKSNLLQDDAATAEQCGAALQLIEKARLAASKVVRANDEASIYDGGDRWFVEFRGHEGMLGGGARVSIAKKDLRVLRVVYGQ